MCDVVLRAGLRARHLFVFLTFLASIGIQSRSHAEDICIAQTAQGANSGPDAANAHAASWFNTASNRGAGTGKIGPGDIVHLTGTISSSLSVGASGSAGIPIAFRDDSQFRHPFRSSSRTSDTGSRMVDVWQPRGNDHRPQENV